MAYTNPQPADFEAYFNRDFPYGIDPETTIQDSDIAKAMVQTNVTINQGLFANQASYNIGYLLLSAHYLVLNLRVSSQGINGQFNWLQNSKGVGQVNEAFTIPQRILDNPYLSMLTKTNYGAEYLQLILPQICGQMTAVYGPPKAL